MSLLAFLVSAPAMSVIHTWVYNRTGGNLVAVWLLHAALGTAWEIFPIVQPGLAGYRPVHIYDFGMVVVVAVAIVLLAGPALGRRAERREQPLDTRPAT